LCRDGKEQIYSYFLELIGVEKALTVGILRIWENIALLIVAVGEFILFHNSNVEKSFSIKV
jgi:hypothetical protein